MIICCIKSMNKFADFFCNYLLHQFVYNFTEFLIIVSCINLWIILQTFKIIVCGINLCKLSCRIFKKKWVQSFNTFAKFLIIFSCINIFVQVLHNFCFNGLEAIQCKCVIIWVVHWRCKCSNGSQLVSLGSSPCISGIQIANWFFLSVHYEGSSFLLQQRIKPNMPTLWSMHDSTTKVTKNCDNFSHACVKIQLWIQISFDCVPWAVIWRTPW